MLKSVFPKALSLLAALMLTACATLPPESKHAHITPELFKQYQTHQRQLVQFNQWRAAGKMALIAPNEKQSARLNWQQSPNNTRLVLSNMLGVTLLEAVQTQEGAQIKADGKTHNGDSLEELIQRLTGYRMPTDVMPLWLTGYVDLALAEDLALDERGHLLNFRQELPGWGEWQVSYGGYYPAKGALPALPAKITLKHPEITIKLIIHQWNR